MNQTPMTREEFTDWIDRHFVPHVKVDGESHKDTERLVVAVFGDDNGDAGMRADVKTLMSTSRRIESWLDGMGRLGKIGTKVLIASAALATLAKTMGWL